ncbi:lipopolysaccharide biosynthesis protein [Clostridium perfringens]|uniref:lipopolysaccharide biosynthesis protein n=1 Tax=Clostridium perfringens TaxID=1502 RepID=UPI0018E47E71|nr:lipopolysaccharide biosynthesis protein [Clostridium perfringens]MBI6063497.1 lipopolysaccharide biosynthesis protein [Clostridium perfringens]MDH2471039.1 lipopolysaccharide biosynthesis protein [Clostridium perfringens]MDU1211969.1 lipopolysaccharide biosynthesis protein [Clostridium perfringens]MDU6697263.1 lipopolysaccharide biosynthesis protein [Clostridium perfringens]
MGTDALKKKTLTGLFWTFTEVISNQGIQFLIQIFLARLILPEEFGLIGMITVFIAISNSIIDSGFSNALIREKEVNQNDYSTVFYFNLITAIVIYVILYFSSPMISVFFAQPKLSLILRVLAITIIINAFGIIPRAILTRKINFKAQMIINISSSLVSGFIAIILAYKGFGIWSLVFRTIIMQFMQALMLSIVNKWRPSLVFSKNSFEKLFGFGWKLLVSGLIDTIYNNLYYMVIGKMYSASDLGYYTNAQKLRDIAATSISTAVQKVSYPVLSCMQNEEEVLKNMYKKIIKSSVYITFPVMFGLAIVARPLILILFGDNWSKSIIYFQILCLAGMLYPLHAINLNILQVKARSDLFLKLEILKKCVSIILIAIAILSKWGVIGLIWMQVVSSVISFFINSYYSKSIIGYSTLNQMKDILPILIITLFMGITTYFIGTFVPNYNFIKILIQISFGSIFFIVISYMFKIKEFFSILDIMKKIFKKIN